MKRWIPGVLLSVLLLLIAAGSVSAAGNAEPDGTAVIFKYDYDQVSQYPLGYNGTLTPERLMEGLTALLGQSVRANRVTVTQDSIIVDLARSSAPIAPPKKAGLYPNTAVYEESILNSIARTMWENFGRDKTLYFTVGGRKHKLETCVLSIDDPFVNIELKLSHQNLKGD